MIGFVAGSGTVIVAPPSAFAWTLIVVVIGYANFVLSGYFKDVEADRQARYFTLPVTFGRAVASRISDIFAFAAAAAMILARLAIDSPLTVSFAAVCSWTMILIALAASFRAQQLLRRVRRDEEAHAPIALVVHAYILGLAGIATAARPDWVLPLCLFYCLFVLTLNARPSRTQI
jgi:4-hydroxybenzoate polyprenyltransferase